MDYENKYKELLARLQKAKENEKVNDGRYCCVIDDIVPELKELENERIRELCKVLVRTCFMNELCTKEDKDECMAWLEKQGKNNMGISEATKQKLEDNLYKALEKETPESWNEFLEKQGEQTSPQTNERAWLHLVSDVLTWKDGIGQYLDDPRVQELAKKLCSEYAQKLYNSVQDIPSEQNPIKREGFITIPFGTDSELIEESITIPDGCVATIEDNRIHIKKGK